MTKSLTCVCQAVYNPCVDPQMLNMAFLLLLKGVKFVTHDLQLELKAPQPGLCSHPLQLIYLLSYKRAEVCAHTPFPPGLLVPG